MSNSNHPKDDPGTQEPPSTPWIQIAAQEAIGAIPDDLEWDADLHDRGEPQEDSSYIEGFNDGIAHARHVARHLRLAIGEITRLRGELDQWTMGQEVRIQLSKREISILRMASVRKHQDPSARDLLSRIVAASLARSENQSDAMALQCPVHDGTLHGAEAEELRAGIESLIENSNASSSDGALEELIGDLGTLLDRVNARDSLAHLETLDHLSAEVDRLKTRRDELLALVAKLRRGEAP